MRAAAFARLLLPAACCAVDLIGAQCLKLSRDGTPASTAQQAVLSTRHPPPQPRPPTHPLALLFQRLLRFRQRLCQVVWRQPRCACLLLLRCLLLFLRLLLARLCCCAAVAGLRVGLAVRCRRPAGGGASAERKTRTEAPRSAAACCQQARRYGSLRGTVQAWWVGCATFARHSPATLRSLEPHQQLRCSHAQSCSCQRGAAPRQD